MKLRIAKLIQKVALIQFLIFSTYSTVGASNKLKEIEIPLYQSEVGCINADSKSLDLLSETWQIRYARFEKYLIKTNQTQSYIFKVLSEHEKLGFVITDSIGNVINVGQESTSRKFQKTLKVSLSKDKKYYLLVGSGSKKRKIPYKILVLENNKISFPINSNRNVNFGNNNFEFEGDTSLFEGKVSQILKLNKIPNKKWIKVNVSSSTFDPILYLLNAKNEVIGFNDDISKSNKNSEIIFECNESVEYIVVSAYKRIKEKKTPYSYEVNLRQADFNPKNKLLSMFGFIINNSIFTFILGVFVTIIVSWFYYKKSVNQKVISHSELVDHTIINEEPEISNLSLNINNDVVYRASLYKYSFISTSKKRITKDLIISPIQIELINIEKILDLKFQSKGTGWENPEKINSRIVQINFNHIDPKDSIELSLIVSHDEKRNVEAIKPHVKGSISEVKLIEEKPYISNMASGFEMLIGILFIIISPLLFLDMYFDFMPAWFSNSFINFWPFVFFGLILYYFLTKAGRRRIFRTVKLAYYLLRDSINFLWKKLSR